MVIRSKKHLARTPVAITQLVSLLLAVTLLLIPGTVISASSCYGTWWIEKGDLSLGEPLPHFGFATCDGEELTTEELAGTPYLLNFWATWCPPCVSELPNLTRFAELHAGEIEVIGISIDDSAYSVKRLLEKVELEYPVGWDSEGIADDLDVDSVPLTIAVDANGKVIALHKGYASNKDLSLLATRLTDSD